MARRKHAESARIDQSLSRIVRRMVVVLHAREPAKWAFFSTHRRPEKKLSGSLAEQPGFEPVVAIPSGQPWMEWLAKGNVRNGMICAST
jgi:hypothetical protein